MVCLIAGFGEHDSQTKMLLVERRMFIQTVQESKGDSMWKQSCFVYLDMALQITKTRPWITSKNVAQMPLNYM